MRKAAKCGMFGFLFLVIFSFVQAVFLPHWPTETDKYKTFYELEENCIDVLFLGNSHQYCSIYPMELYNDFGIRSFNLGSAGQTLQQSYYQLREAYRTQKVKYVFLDVLGLFSNEDENGSFDYHYAMIVSMKNGEPKYEFAKRFANDDQELAQVFLPLLKFHDRWNALSEDDFMRENTDKSKGKYGAYFSSKVSRYLGFNKIKEQSEIVTDDSYLAFYKENEATAATVSPYTINSESEVYFKKIVEFCKNNGIVLVTIKAPGYTSWNEKRHDVVFDFLENYQLEFVDMVIGQDKVNIDLSTDTSDGGTHCNIRGG